MGFKTKAKDALARRVSRQRVITMVYGAHKYVETFTRTGKIVKVRLDEAVALQNTPLPWNIGIYFLCRSADGKAYMKGEEVTLPYPIFHHKIDAVMAEYHLAAYKRLSVVDRDFITYGWTATTGGPLDEQTVSDMFAQSGVWQR